MVKPAWTLLFGFVAIGATPTLALPNENYETYEEALRSFVSADYLRAIALCQSHIERSESREPCYVILGASHLELGQYDQAEPYLLQSIKSLNLSGKDRATAQWNYLRLQAWAWRTDDRLDDMRTFVSIVRELRRARVAPYGYDWVQVEGLVESTLAYLRNPSGKWIDEDGSLLRFTKLNSVSISRKSDDEYTIFVSPSQSPPSLVLTLSGTLRANDEHFRGGLWLRLVFGEAPEPFVVWQQQTYLDLSFSDNMRTLEGTITYLPGETVGRFYPDAKELVVEALRPGTFEVSLVRKE